MATNAVASVQHHIRVISIYATRWRWTGEVGQEQPHLSLGQLEEFYGLFHDQLPQVIHRLSHKADNIAFAPRGDNSGVPSNASVLTPSNEGVEITRADSWLFVLPSDQVVAALDFDVRSELLSIDPLPIVKLLEQCAYARLVINGAPLEAHIANIAEQVGAKELDENRLLPPERHQIVFTEHAEDSPPDDEMIKMILYRVEPPK